MNWWEHDTKLDAGSVIAAVFASAWNLIASGELNQGLATVGGFLTILVLIQRIVINCRKSKHGKDG